MILTLLWLAGNVQYIVLWGEDTALNQQVAIAMLGTAAAIIGSYVFGAAWDDINKRKVEAEYPTPPPAEDEGEP
jgi:hypothetical protein